MSSSSAKVRDSFESLCVDDLGSTGESLVPHSPFQTGRRFFEYFRPWRISRRGGRIIATISLPPRIRSLDSIDKRIELFDRQVRDVLVVVIERVRRLVTRIAVRASSWRLSSLVKIRSSVRSIFTVMDLAGRFMYLLGLVELCLA